MLRYAKIQDAKEIVNRWDGDSRSVTLIGNHAASVFRFSNSEGKDQILRLCDPSFRSLPEIIAELNFVNHLHADGVPVAFAIPTLQGELAMEYAGAAGVFVCSSVAYAPGVAVDEKSEHWNTDFFEAWGKSLALIHNSSVQIKQAKGPYRWSWENEILFRRAEELIPTEDIRSRDEIEELFSQCKLLGVSSEEFGLIHADHAPQNFMYDAERNCLTSFDFGNCCYHWFISDLAISLSTIRRKPNRNLIKQSMLKGYTSVRSLPADYERLIELFIRLRVVYFYLSRLYMWTNPTPQQKDELRLFQERVHSQTGWGAE